MSALFHFHSNSWPLFLLFSKPNSIGLNKSNVGALPLSFKFGSVMETFRIRKTALDNPIFPKNYSFPDDDSFQKMLLTLLQIILIFENEDCKKATSCLPSFSLFYTTLTRELKTSRRLPATQGEERARDMQ
jgi:hypothetical protein